MRSLSQVPHRVPTHIVTGFLGAGKTSTILHLLEQRPAEERWAVLVNEFGTIGVDGAMVAGNRIARDGVSVLELPGGCLCCAVGPLLRVLLEHLLNNARPDRLLIEPSGLGHPVEVVQMLGSESYREHVAVQKIATVVDARQLRQPLYRAHPTYNQQLAIADVVLGNKLDLYHSEDRSNLMAHVEAHCSAHTEVALTTHGKFDLAELSGPLRAAVTASALGPADDAGLELELSPLPKCGYLRTTNQGDGFESIGWRIDPVRKHGGRCAPPPLGRSWDTVRKGALSGLPGRPVVSGCRRATLQPGVARLQASLVTASRPRSPHLAAR